MANWRLFFTDFRGQRFDAGHSEEIRYQAFKARFLSEMRQARLKAEQKAEKEHKQIMYDVYGPHGQG